MLSPADLASTRLAVNMYLLKSLWRIRINGFHHVVTILRNLFTKEFVDNVNSGLKRLLARLWGVRMKEHCIIDTNATIEVCQMIDNSRILVNCIVKYLKTKKVRKRLADVFRNEGSDKFLTGSDDTDVNWEYHHKIPVDGFAAHKDEIV
ncbi:7100_t:CDS:2 [Funneliformis mosseae]|uniref:7100_t:CDS:1 n=1 Tax=Funneliformis mosseae TaxID=27381 RepID=A0A9N8V300_FUNMO|nr:7100_t:CDS:2 [Funneliformis mosseae]